MALRILFVPFDTRCRAAIVVAKDPGTGDSMVERTSKLWVLRMASLLFANSSGPFRRLGPDWDPMGIMNSI